MRTICAVGRGEISSEACLQCALSADNHHPDCGFDPSLIKALQNRQDRSGEIHVTDLLSCPLKVYFDKKEPAAEYLYENLARMTGIAVHDYLKLTGNGASKAELPLELEGLVGQADRYYEDGRVVDYKCQPAGELITMADGSERPIEELHIFDRVLAWGDGVFVPARITAIVDGGMQEIFEIMVASGQKLRVSGNHPILTDRGWVETRELRAEQDRVTVLRDWTGGMLVPDEDARLLGYLVGDGGLSQYGIRFTNQDLEIVSDLRDICLSKGWVLSGPSSDIDYRITDHGLKRSTGPSAFIKRHGLYGKTSREKTVPMAIMCGDFDVIAQFLGAYFDCDGTITDPESGIPARATLVTTSPVLARQASELFRRLGITNRVYEHNVGYGNKVTGLGYHVCIWQADAMVRFYNVVPFRCQYKRDRLARWLPALGGKLSRGKNLRRIDRIEPIGEMQTIGIETEEYHTYITNGVVTHNTTRWIYPDKLPYGSHQLQVNIYAYMLKKQGKPVNSAAIQYIDLSGPSKCRKCKLIVRWEDGQLVCPKCGAAPSNAHLGAVLIEVGLLPEYEVKELIEKAKKDLRFALDNNEPPRADPGYLCGYCSHLWRCEAGLEHGV